MGRRSFLKCICPRCGEIGSITYRRGSGFYVNHGTRTAHRVPSDISLKLVGSDRLTFIRFPGGDHYLIKYLLEMIPPHTVYVEVFGGSAKLLICKPPSKIEVYNDLDNDLVNLFKVVKEKPREFLAQLDLVLYSRHLFYEYLRKLRNREYSSDVERAALYYYISWCGMATKSVYKTSFQGGIGRNKVVSFFNALKHIREIHRRLKRVMIENLDFRECIKRYDSSRTFFYLDPPHLYVSTEKDKSYYTPSFTEADYMDLLNILTKIKGKFLLKQSGIIGYLKEWAQNNKYYVRELKLVKNLGVVKGEKREHWSVIFIANYKI
ncbi:MAG: DNA adenine methylase [Desulfurococcaceae archaeon]